MLFGFGWGSVHGEASVLNHEDKTESALEVWE